MSAGATALRRGNIAGAGLAALLLCIEGLAAASLVTGAGWRAALIFAVGHGLASLGAALLWHMAPRGYRHRMSPGATMSQRQERPVPRRERLWGYGLLSVMAFCLPVVGLLGVIAAILPALHRPVAQTVRDWRSAAIPPLPRTLSDRSASSVSELRPLIDIIQDTASSVDERMTAVLALRHLPGRVAVPVLRVALGDPVDDVRLLAYAMLYRRDDALISRIQDYELLVSKEPSGSDDALAMHYALAHLYWEQAYTGLAAGAVALRALGSAEEHTRAALSAAETGDGATALGVAGRLTMRFLLGRILMQRGATDEAESTLRAAREAGFPAPSITPLLAELAYRRGDLAGLKEHLSALEPGEAERPGPVCEMTRFWLSGQSSPAPIDPEPAIP